MAQLPDRPLLKPWYRLARRDGVTVLEYGHRAVVLTGRAVERLLPALLPLLDGEHTVDEIVEALGAAAAPAVDAALQLLAGRGLLTAGPPAPGDATADFLAAVGGSRSPAALRARLAGARVDVAGGAPVAGRVARLLRQAGVEVLRAPSSGPAPDAPAALFAPDGSELPLLRGWNAAALAARTSWLQVLPFDGRIVAVGPLVVPGETACGECFARRRQSCLGYGDESELVDATPAYRPSAPPLDAAAAGIAAGVLLRWLAGDLTVAGRMLALTWAPPSLTSHLVYRVPRCGACSPAEAVAPLLPWFKAAA